MAHLKSKLLSLNNSLPQDRKTKIFSPKNTEELRIPFRIAQSAKVVGRLAALPPPTNSEESRILNGVLVQNDFKLSLMAPEDLREYAALTTTTIHCKQRLTLAAAGIELIKWALEGTFGAIEEIIPTPPQAAENINTNGSTTPPDDDAEGEIERPLEISTAFLIMGSVIVRHQSPGGEVTVEWEGSMLNDGIADAVLAVLFSVESSPAAVKHSASTNGHNHHQHHLGQRNPHAGGSSEERFERLCMFLEAQFGTQVSPIAKPRLNLLRLQSKTENADGIKKDEDEDGDEQMMTEDEREELEAQELERLHAMGVPVPGVEIRVDKNVARVWLEDLEVECANAVLRDRVKAVVERSVEVVSPMWRGK